MVLNRDGEAANKPVLELERIFMADYAHPEVLVEPGWVKENLGKPGIKIIEIDVDKRADEAGHIPGAVGLDWQVQLQDPLSRDIVGREAFGKLVGGAGIGPADTVALYGDHSNWFAAYGFWLFKLYGHRDVRLLNGARSRWLKDPDLPMNSEKPSAAPVAYEAAEPDLSLRAFSGEVLEGVRGGGVNLVDVRTPEEYSGKVIAPPGMSETAQRGGHVPGACSIPWNKAVKPDGTFKPVEELREIYLEDAGVDPARTTITYCRIGERSSHTWFVLKYLLGLEKVKNYDGSWTEYGNLIGAPIEKSA